LIIIFVLSDLAINSTARTRFVSEIAIGVGAPVGAALVGARDGLTVTGLLDGVLDGALVGLRVVGDVLGDRLGAVVVGLIVGLLLGLRDGSVVGAAVGLIVCTAGERVGVAEGVLLISAPSVFESDGMEVVSLVPSVRSSFVTADGRAPIFFTLYTVLFESSACTTRSPSKSSTTVSFVTRSSTTVSFVTRSTESFELSSNATSV
jgi:hypothetical protein